MITPLHFLYYTRISQRTERIRVIKTYSGQTGQLVVHHGGHVELQELDVFCYNVRCSAALLVPSQLVIDFHNIS